MTKKKEDLAKSVDELRAEVKELRELVDMLVGLVINMEQDDSMDFDSDFVDFGPLNRDNRFSM